MVTTPYDKYLRRQRAAKLGKIGTFQQGMQSMTQTSRALSDAYSGSRVGNVSASARAATMQQALQTTQRTQAELTAERMRSESQRADQLSREIGQLETQRDAYLEAKRKEKKAQKRQKWVTGLELLGSAVGTVAGAITGGPAGAMTGARVGAGVGQAVGGLVDGGTPADYNAAIQGASEAMLAYGSYATTQRTKKSLSVLSQNMSKLSNLPSTQLYSAGIMLQNLISAGASEQDILKAIEGFSNGLPSQVIPDSNVDLSTQYEPDLSGF